MEIPEARIERQFECRGEPLTAKIFLLNHCLQCIAYRGDQRLESPEPMEHMLPPEACQSPAFESIADRFLTIVLVHWKRRVCA